jgi:hypothetical protein
MMPSLGPRGFAQRPAPSCLGEDGASGPVCWAGEAGPGVAVLTSLIVCDPRYADACMLPISAFTVLFP